MHKECMSSCKWRKSSSSQMFASKWEWDVPSSWTLRSHISQPSSSLLWHGVIPSNCCESSGSVWWCFVAVFMLACSACSATHKRRRSSSISTTSLQFCLQVGVLKQNCLCSVRKKEKLNKTKNSLGWKVLYVETFHKIMSWGLLPTCLGGTPRSHALNPPQILECCDTVKTKGKLGSTAENCQLSVYYSSKHAI